MQRVFGFQQARTAAAGAQAVALQAQRELQEVSQRHSEAVAQVQEARQHVEELQTKLDNAQEEWYQLQVRSARAQDGIALSHPALVAELLP